MRELLVELRDARTEAAFRAAAAGVRGWCAGMALSAPLPLTCDAMPREPELQALLDPLADSALARMDVPASSGEAASHGLRGVRRRPRLDRTEATVMPRQAAHRISPADPRVRGAQAPSPARVAAWLARHEHLGATIEAAASASEKPRIGRSAADNVVRLPLRREPTAASSRVPAQPMAATASRLLRWQQLLESPQARAALGVAAAEPAAREATESRLAGQAPAQARAPAPAAAPTQPRSRTLAELTPAAPTQLRSRTLAELTAAAPMQPRSRTPGELTAAARPGVPARRGEAEEPSPALSPEALVAISARLERIEQRLVTAAPAATLAARETPQWFNADDDALAERIHAILRRQALRHGIVGP
jgi:hypothetical protein